MPSILMINITNVSGDGKMRAYDRDIILIGPAVNDELILKRFTIPVRECEARDKKDAPTPSINLSFINTAVR